MIELSDKEKQLFEDAKKFSLSNFAPTLSQWENGKRSPKEAIKILSNNGYCGLGLPEKLGGGGYSFLERALIYEGLAHGCGTISFLLQLHNNIIFEIGNYYETDPELNNIILDMTKGKKTIAFALTEESSGSDPLAINTYAVLKNDGYHIHGKKVWIANALEADFFNVIVKNGSPETEEMLMLLVSKDNPKLKVSEDKPRIGSNAMSCCDLEFNECIVNEKMLLSNKGYSETLKAIDIARTFVPAIAIGISQRVIDMTIEYLGERISFNRPIIKNQGIQWSLADLLARVEAGRWMVYRTASMMNKGERISKQTAMTKLYTTDVAMDTTIKCLQFFGAKGYDKDSVLSMYMGLAKLLQIIDGTSEIQKIVIGRNFVSN